MIKCKKCNEEIDNKAKKCPNCGAPVSEKSMYFIIVGIIIAVVGIYFYFGSSNIDEKKITQICKDNDFACIADKNVVAADNYCQEPIETMAKSEIKWTDGTSNRKMSKFRWKNKSKHVVTYIGDKAQLKNNFGDFVNIIYECDFKIDSKEVLDTRLREGTL